MRISITFKDKEYDYKGENKDKEDDLMAIFYEINTCQMEREGEN